MSLRISISCGTVVTAFALAASSLLAGDVRELSGTNGAVAVNESNVIAVPLMGHRGLSETEMHRLGPLSSTETGELNGSRVMESASERLRVGLVRDVESGVGFDGSRPWRSSSSASHWGGGRLERVGDRLIWTTGFSSEGAGALRLHLEDIVLPSGAVAFVYAANGEVHGPYPIGGDVPHDQWTNAVFADEVFLEIQVPAGNFDPEGVRLSVKSIAHLEHEWFAPSVSRMAKAAPEALASCFKDVNCVDRKDFPELENAARAIAHISYREGLGVYVCTGGLVNTTAGTSIPYFLTANHCVGTAESAASLEAYWDYKTTSCGASANSRGGFARTLGATLLATGAKDLGKADFTLLRLSQQPPAGRFYLGWSAEKVVTGGSVLYRIAHPEGSPQSYSAHQVSSVPTPGSCDDLPTTRFIYSKNIDGSTKPGSSGSPLFIRDGLKVVGQLFGRCGRNLDDSCDSVGNSAVDGSFAAYFDDVRQWLAPAPLEKCKNTALNLCLTKGRFRVDVLARDLRTGRGTTGTAIPQNDVFGYFSLPELTGQSENPEIFVKIVNGSALNGKFWVFYGGLTDLEFALTVTDMETGMRKTYSKDGGGYCGDSDTTAF